MKFENYIFSGFGYSTGKYKIKNSDIEDAIETGFLQGFSNDKIQNNEKYKSFLIENPNSSPLDYFAGHIMGFYERYYVTPFPPTRKKLYYSETSLELGIKAIQNALNDACIQPNDIDAWFVSTVSPNEQAPGIAARIKSYFTDFDKHSPAFTIASGCAGFNMNLGKALQYLKSHRDVNHVVVAHCETMSSFLTQRTKFVPFVTFGDAAAAVIISRTFDNKPYGIINIVNKHDLKMLDYVGVDDDCNLYMDDKFIKDRAIENIPDASKECLQLSNWKNKDIDLFVPHQTGNIIIKPSAEKLNILSEKVFLYAQNYYGNVSGSTVPLSLALLKEQGKLVDGTKILSATAGVGGNYGAFTYIHAETQKQKEFYLYNNDLIGKSVLVLGASGYLGLEISKELQKRGANLILHANKNLDKLKMFKNAEIIACDFTDKQSVNSFIEKLHNNNNFDYLVKVSGECKTENCFDINFYSPVEIINSIISKIKKAIINIGSATEDANVFENDTWVSSNRAFHGYLSSASGEFFKYGIRTVYLQPAFLEKGIVEKLNQKNVFKFMMKVGQTEALKSENIAVDIVNSLYIPKVIHIQYEYENAMLLGRMGYKLEVDI